MKQGNSLRDLGRPSLACSFGQQRAVGEQGHVKRGHVRGLGDPLLEQAKRVDDLEAASPNGVAILGPISPAIGIGPLDQAAFIEKALPDAPDPATPEATQIFLGGRLLLHCLAGRAAQGARAHRHAATLCRRGFWLPGRFASVAGCGRGAEAIFVRLLLLDRLRELLLDSRQAVRDRKIGNHREAKCGNGLRGAG